MSVMISVPFYVALSLLSWCGIVFGAPPRDLLMPPMQFDFYNIKTPQLLGIIAGAIVFFITIAVVIYLLYASGTLGNAWREIVIDAKNGVATSLSPKSKTSRITSPFSSQPELYDHLLHAKATLSKNINIGEIKGNYVTIRNVALKNDSQWLFEASNGSPQYHESAYDLARVWGWHDVDISVDGSNSSNQPWVSKESFEKWVAEHELDSRIHIVIEENEYKKPIGLITLSNHSVQNLSLNIENTWITPAFQGQDRAHEAYFLMLDHFFAQGYRRISAELDERNIIGRKLLQKCGFQLEATLRKHKVIQKRNSNTALYVILNSEWQEILPKLMKKYEPDQKKDISKKD